MLASQLRLGARLLTDSYPAGPSPPYQADRQVLGPGAESLEAVVRPSCGRRWWWHDHRATS